MSALSEHRRRAIERSGWGEEFRLIQPHNLAFWVYCLLVVFGAVVLSGQISIASAAYSGALTSGIIVFALLAAWGTIIARTLASIPSHWMYTGVFGAGLIWFVGRPDAPARRGLGAGLMLTAMLMHGLWDASAGIAGDNVISIVPGIVAFVLISVFVWVYRSSVGIEREWMWELMAPEVELGVITPAELEALAGPRARTKDYIRSQPSGCRAKQVLQAETALAHQLARDGGVETEEVRRARVAVARTRAA